MMLCVICVLMVIVLETYFDVLLVLLIPSLDWRWITLMFVVKGLLTNLVLLLMDRCFRIVQSTGRLAFIWCTSTALLASTVFTLESREHHLSNKIHPKILGTFRIIDLVMFIVFSVIQEARKLQQIDVEHRVLRLCKSHELMTILGKAKLAGGLFCCHCLGKFQPSEMTVEFPCHHLAHMGCEVKWFHSRPAGVRPCCPMLCSNLVRS
eukprot:TRINITY_DN71298_c0_g1_i1.p1 TRINITY_DN71298_c0_g1~~TRINITY_DN71298_c0_g1_i1.p1  ORF type:complete len:208 (+),score=15.19 TRINITY_DN71298_c0_g1_i1:2-625(+)